MKGILIYLYAWGCLVTFSIVGRPTVGLATIDKVVRVAMWPLFIETLAITNSAKELVKP